MIMYRHIERKKQEDSLKKKKKLGNAILILKPVSS